MRILTLFSALAGVHAYLISCYKATEDQQNIVFWQIDRARRIVMFQKGLDYDDTIEDELTTIVMGHEDREGLVGNTIYSSFRVENGKAHILPKPGEWCIITYAEESPEIIATSRTILDWLKMLDILLEYAEVELAKLEERSDIGEGQETSTRTNLEEGLYELFFQAAQTRSNLRKHLRDGPCSVHEYALASSDMFILEWFHGVLEKGSSTPKGFFRTLPTLTKAERRISELEHYKESWEAIRDQRSREKVQSFAVVVMVILWYYYQHSTSQVVRGMLPLVIIPYTLALLYKALMGEEFVVLLNIGLFEWFVGEAKWARLFCSGYGTLHQNQDGSILDKVVSVTRIPLFVVLTCIQMRVKAPSSYSIYIHPIIFRFTEWTFKNTFDNMRTLFMALQIFQGFYLWEGYTNRSRIERSVRKQFVVTIIMMAARVIWSCIILRQPIITQGYGVLYNVSFEAALPFVVFYMLWNGH
ncbi:hypothetical protein DICA2_C04698 [Diutina catenulata]